MWFLMLLCMMGVLWPSAGHCGDATTSTTTVEKDQSQTVTAYKRNGTNVDLTVIQDVKVAGSAEAHAEVYDGLEHNVITESGGQSVANIRDGFAGASGIVSVNQSPGNNNNQGNAVSFSCVEADGGTALMADGSAQVLNRDNLLEATDMMRANVMDRGAFQDFTGALQINQSAGNLNNQNNILCIAAGGHGVVAMTDAALGQQVAGNTIHEMRVMKQDIIAAGAFNNTSGVVSINQSSGCGNNQTNIIVISLQRIR
ncbi:MAG: hypothetical protein V2A77_05390 [Pseudomonadota bacterium]